MTNVLNLMVLVPAVALPLMAGCSGSDGIQTKDVSGTVTYEGKPVPYGTILFLPDKAKNHFGPAGRAEIVEGSYNTDNNGRPLVPGPHVITITGFTERPPLEANENPNYKMPYLFQEIQIESDIINGENNFNLPQ